MKNRTSDLRDITPRQAQSRLKNYKSYVEAKRDYPDLDSILIRIGFINEPHEAFQEFLATPRLELTSTCAIKSLPKDHLTIQFIVKTILKIMLEKNYYKPTIKMVKNYFSLNDDGLRIILAKYKIISNCSETSFLTFSELIKLIQSTSTGRISQETIDRIAFDICNQITLRAALPCNEENLLKYALSFDSFAPYCLFFNATTDTINSRLSVYSIYKDDQYVRLTFNDLCEKIKEIRPRFQNENNELNEEGLLKELKLYIGSSENIYLPLDKQQDIFHEKLFEGLEPLTNDEILAIDSFLGENIFTESRKRRAENENENEDNLLEEDTRHAKNLRM